MLTLITGPAASGKTHKILSQIRRQSAEGQRGIILLVPEQFSHESERRLCAFCGDSVSLHAEVLSFSLLSARVFAQSGGLADPVLDGGGRLLVLLSALRAVEGQLRLLRPLARRPEFLSELLHCVDELKTCRIQAQALADAAAQAGGELGDKLSDLSLILGAYQAICAQGSFDPRDRLDKLRDDIERLGFGRGRNIYIDNFTDFTAQEAAVLEALLKNGADLTVSLCCDDIYDPDGADAFAIPRRTANRLLRMAAQCGTSCQVDAAPAPQDSRSPGLLFFQRALFSPAEEASAPELGRDISIIACPDMLSECRAAAAEICRLVRESGYRYRDISVAANGFADYEAAAESVFSEYGIPVFFSRKSDLLQKPLLALVDAALDTVLGGYAYADMFRYLKTGLAGLDTAECDTLENYVLKWNIRGSLWTREAPWALHPQGFSEALEEDDAALLGEIDALRRRAAEPLARLERRGAEAESAREQVLALYDFLESLNLESALAARAEQFRAAGQEALAEEYVQLWEILTGSLEQCALILGDTPMEQGEFSRLLRLLFSQYDVGTIPISLDRVNLGDLDRVRAKHVKCLILLGATGERLPRSGGGQELLSDSERESLAQLGLELSGGESDALLRELYLIYASLALPSERLLLTFPAQDGGERCQPSFVVNRAQLLFQKQALPFKSISQDAALSAPLPALTLAAAEPDSLAGQAARAYLSKEPAWAPRLEAVLRAAALPRGNLSPAATAGLYGKQIRMSSSRVDKYNSCHFAYFMQYGLKARPRKRAELDALEIGTFLHDVLENVSRQAKEMGGFSQVGDAQLQAMTEASTALYAERKLGGLAGKSSRFRYLFTRLTKKAVAVVLDMAAELRRSDFAPLDFELRFADGAELPPVITKNGDLEMRLSGAVDRVDGWLHDGKLYLRVVDYKTGKKSFDLSDIWYGMGMQMLMYLFMLADAGQSRYGQPIVPAGVLYAPARDALLPGVRGAGPEAARAQRAKEKRRSGLILNDPALIQAMEKSDAPEFIPIKFMADGTPAGSLATAEQFGLLRRHIEKILQDIAGEIRSGGIPAAPCVTGGKSACDFCEFAAACHFDPQGGDAVRDLPRLKEPQVWEKIREEAGT